MPESLPLSWPDLIALAGPEPDRVNGPTSAQARLRLFGEPESAVRVTLYRDHHAWCPYCQKVWLWLEERRIPYRVRKVTMFCYGEKEDWFRRLVPSGMLPALELDGRLITESDRILDALEAVFAPLGPGLHDPRVLPLRRFERQLFSLWCQWLCRALPGPSEARAEAAFDQQAGALDRLLQQTSGPFLLGSEFSTADLVFVPYLERMNASLAYYKGYRLRHRHRAIDAWFAALEQRSTYLGTQGDFHTHAHDLPPQMGGCHANGSVQQQHLASRIDVGPWPIAAPDQSDPETSQPPPVGAGLEALTRVCRHRSAILARNPLGPQGFDLPLRLALMRLVEPTAPAPPAGSAVGLRYLRDRISVPRDMSLHAARALRRALEQTASRDPADPAAAGPVIPVHHRRDQDPAPFLLADRQECP